LDYLIAREARFLSCGVVAGREAQRMGGKIQLACLFCHPSLLSLTLAHFSPQPFFQTHLLLPLY